MANLKDNLGQAKLAAKLAASKPKVEKPKAK